MHDKAPLIDVKKYADKPHLNPHGFEAIQSRGLGLHHYSADAKIRDRKYGQLRDRRSGGVRWLN